MCVNVRSHYTTRNFICQLFSWDNKKKLVLVGLKKIIKTIVSGLIKYYGFLIVPYLENSLQSPIYSLSHKSGSFSFL